MAQPPGSTNPESGVSLRPNKVNPRSDWQTRLSRTDASSLGRYRGHATAATATLSRESLFHSSLTLPGAGVEHRRIALRELLGLPGLLGALPAGWPSEEHPQVQRPGELRRLSAQGGSRMCLEPREHAWMLASAEGRFEVLKELLELEPELLTRSDPITGYSVLHWLAKHGRHEEIILLFDFAQSRGLSLDVSAPGSGGLTPLHLAALQGHDMVIKVLVGALGADPTRRDHSGHRACHYLRPNASQSMRDLSGAEEWETAAQKERDNANNNSSTSVWSLRRTPSASRTKSAGTRCKEAASHNAEGSRGAQINGFLRHLFPFFQDR